MPPQLHAGLTSLYEFLDLTRSDIGPKRRSGKLARFRTVKSSAIHLPKGGFDRFTDYNAVSRD